MNIKNLKINSFKLEMKSLHHKKLELKKNLQNFKYSTKTKTFKTNFQ